jgi:hypothetical protein
MFRMIERGEHGDTVYGDNPKIDAYKQIAYIVNVLGRGYRLVCHENGDFTVHGDGLAAITYARG